MMKIINSRNICEYTINLPFDLCISDTSEDKKNVSNLLKLSLNPFFYFYILRPQHPGSHYWSEELQINFMVTHWRDMIQQKFLRPLSKQVKIAIIKHDHMYAVFFLCKIYIKDF